MFECNEFIEYDLSVMKVQTKASLMSAEASLDPHTQWCLSVLQDVLLAGLSLRSDLEKPRVDPFEEWVSKNWSLDTSVTSHDGWIILLALARNPALSRLEKVLGFQQVAELKNRLNETSEAAQGGDERVHNLEAGEELLAWLTLPFREAPEGLEDQIRWVLEHWPHVLDGDLRRVLLRTLDRIAEYHTPRQGGAAVHQAPGLNSSDELERFTDDSDWMTRCVLIAKHTCVWLDQLSTNANRVIERLDEIPDDALAELVERGFTTLWLIGLWVRSSASQTIKKRRGNLEAEASAYSLTDYRVADRFGGAEALDRLRERAGKFGLRLAADMVPNHTGLDSRWMVEHPDWFVQLDQPPFPGYSFNGPDISGDQRLCVQLEDGYWDESDAAVVFRVTDPQSGRERYVYHGNDGTQMPWNDTAQLDHAQPVVREALIQTIIDVARQFSVIRFDAAMTLAKQHIQRLWHPPAGQGGAIASRASYGLSAAEFERLCPEEFWCEVVDRVRLEAPDTLLIAEAFWMMEGYFVRRLGMHRVYNSAFMHMLRDENNVGYRDVIKEVLATQPAVLERFVNFMNNPDEETAAEQFGTGDKYFGIATLLSTLPGLPMFGHGQTEGLREKYGMEFAKAYHKESTDEGLLGYHERVIFPLLKARRRFGGVEFFRFFDLVDDHGEPSDNVYAYCNKAHAEDSSTLVIYNNSIEPAVGWLNASVPFKAAADEDGLRSERLVDALRLQRDKVYRLEDSGRGVTRHEDGQTLWESGLRVELGGYETLVFDRLELEMERPVVDQTKPEQVASGALADGVHAPSSSPVEFEG